MKVAIYGASSPHPALLLDACNYDNRFWFQGYIDDTMGGERWGMPILGGREKIPELAAQGVGFINTISSSGLARYRVGRAIVDGGGTLVDMIYPETFRFEHGPGAYIQEGVHIQAGVTMGDNCTAHLGAIISHEVQIGHSCFIGAGTLAGRVQFGDGAYLGIGAVVFPDVKIGRWATIGAGAIVTKDVEDGAVVVGNPARVLRINPVPNHGGAMTPLDMSAAQDSWSPA